MLIDCGCNVLADAVSCFNNLARFLDTAAALCHRDVDEFKQRRGDNRNNRPHRSATVIIPTDSTALLAWQQYSAAELHDVKMHLEAANQFFKCKF